MEEYNLYSEFDLQKHKEVYNHYLEVAIDENGKVHYAVPSHTEYLIKVCMKKYQVPRKVLDAMCPEDFYYSFAEWLCKMSGHILVWNDFTKAYSFNQAQIDTLRTLKNSGVYYGDVPERVGKVYRSREVSFLLSECSKYLWKGKYLSIQNLDYVLMNTENKSEIQEAVKYNQYLHSCHCPSCDNRIHWGDDRVVYCSKCGQKLWVRKALKEEIEEALFEHEMDEYED